MMMCRTSVLAAVVAMLLATAAGENVDTISATDHTAQCHAAPHGTIVGSGIWKTGNGPHAGARDFARFFTHLSSPTARFSPAFRSVCVRVLFLRSLCRGVLRVLPGQLQGRRCRPEGL